TQEQIKSCGAVTEDVDGFTDYVRSIKGVEVIVMFLEINKKSVRMNFRSKGKVVVNQIAEKFNGGGHKFAAGAITKLTLDETINKVLPDVRNAIRNVFFA
ncbi:MAG: DHH family phosphoesterase, partial [Candidatus Marinimicrobia bacterium]|nr:DHH family phosphoesterase [Candidatus Neomarinimicrobiota bacterium]